MSGNKNKIIAFNYFGGKFTWLEYLYKYFPDGFTHLVDLFAGSMVVSLNYPGNVIKTANEINSDITNFFEVLRDHEPELIRLLLLTPCSLQEYNNSWNKPEFTNYTTDKIERARRFYVRVRQSFFGLGAQRKNKGWHMAKQHTNAKGGETVSRWNNALEKLHEVAEVLRSNFQITNLDFSDCIDKIQFQKCFFYCDPPYVAETRKSFNDYKFEFSESDHIRLATKLHSTNAMAMVSGYESDLYNNLYRDWTKIKFPSKLNNIRSGLVTEVIWINYEIKRDLFSNF